MPNKAGTAYERLATAATMLMLNSKDARHDVSEEGISGTSHQLDGVIDGSIILEAKDHSISGGKVNLNELQNHQGVMLDLKEAKTGFFASSTGYTKDAVQYATGTDSHPRLIKTDIADIRHSTPEDEKGRIKEIQINIIYPFLATERGNYQFIWDDKVSEEQFAKGICKSNRQGIRLEVFLENYINMNGPLLYIDKLKYRIPVEKISDFFVVMKEGDSCLLFKSESLGINKLITDVEMKEALKRLK